jgi:hypothetical protein
MSPLFIPTELLTIFILSQSKSLVEIVGSDKDEFYLALGCYRL